ncbi:hypothetical protein [Candidatus Symbiothrix dinenymphae]|uniref:hypothetical protein n=1 Tax=Candidatus Symbiothrix dinenymphae TaxID=467085 RepID=UPI0006C1AB2C|nr:hypothetical protein [Candidatus Symbiothrix dinenymphae]GAP71985.1 hypothetical protein SAMD00024442_21_31 [Candidatus Symbiothrix dinenymphae]
MIVICDSSPVVALAVLDQLDLLDRLFNGVIIPQHVFDELTINDKPAVSKISEWAKGKVVAAADKRLMQIFNQVKAARTG